MVAFWKLAKEISPLGRGIKPKVKKDQHSVDKWSLKPLFYKIKPIDHSRRWKGPGLCNTGRYMESGFDL